MPAKKNKIPALFNKARSLASDLMRDDQIEIHSNNFALITGCRKLTEYNKNKVALSFRNMDVEITGNELEADSLLNGQMSLTGSICEVRYIDNKKDN